MSLSQKRKLTLEVEKQFEVATFPFLFKISLNNNFQVVTLTISFDYTLRPLNMKNFNEKRLPEKQFEFMHEIEGVFLQEIRAYFSGKSPYPNPPHALNCSDFSKRVLSALRLIPPGEVVTYQELAEEMGLKNGARAIGQALAKNPLPLIYPCHRVVSKSGLGGYSQGKLLKYLLLLLEKRFKF